MPIDRGMDKEDKKMWYIYIYIYYYVIMEYYSAIKKNEIILFATTWIRPRDCHTERVCQTEKQI